MGLACVIVELQRPVALFCACRARVRSGTAAVRMASELSKTAISTMRVNELRQELESRGLEVTGIRPVLQARLGEGE